MSNEIMTMQNINIVTATLADYPVIKNMARFYAYDLSRQCGFISKEWMIPPDGLYTGLDVKNYFEDPTRRAYLIRVGEELAGFVLLNSLGSSASTEWNMGEFFILAKFQGKGIGGYVATMMFDQHPGIWEVAMFPENHTALSFWRKTIADYTQEQYQCETKHIRPGQAQPYRVVFTFDTHTKKGMSGEQQQNIPIPDHADINFLTQKINTETLQYGTAYLFGFFIRDEMDQIIAGCNGSVIYGAIYTDQLWVAPSHRKLGLGRRLMEQVHDYGRKEHCKMATAVTMDFQQARIFYEKLGYVCDFERQGYVQNSTCYFLRKSL
jgi:predicted acetyltransferase